MIQITKTQYQEMLNLGILKETNKNWVTTSVKKKSKRKKRYVDEFKFKKYLAIKNGKEFKIDEEEYFLGY